ncbi:N-acetyltransferase family protein [Tropicibacter sp. S64]|uniref:GNAT family N-acetyltransferase n=1 Tax=Tropicibacter sp. S64 TaxID=3415122 RepID=UPI003C7BF4BD
MITVSLRPAHPGDALRLGAILSSFTDEADWLPRVHSRAEDIAHAGDLIEKGWVTLAETPAGPCGFLARDHKTVHALYVSPDHRGRAIGTALLNDAKTATGALELWTFQANHGAQRFYERAGFAEAERTDGAANDEGLPDIRYVWSALAGESNA